MPRRSPSAHVGEALAWASRLIAVGLAMFLPTVAGGWADARLGTRFLAPAGLVVGFVTGLGWLVRMTARQGRG
jgi:hypothetical protein